MKKRLALLLLVGLMVAFLLTKTPIIPILLASPWWMYFVIAGIFISGGLALKYTLEDRRVEQEWIEREGNEYLERIRKERERRKKERVGQTP